MRSRLSRLHKSGIVEQAITHRDLWFGLTLQCVGSVTQSCPTLCYPMDGSLPGSSVHGISQATIQEWVAISFSRGSSWRKAWTRVFCVVLSQFSHAVVSDSLWLHRQEHTRPPCPPPTPRVYSNSCPLSWWCHQTVSSSVIPFSSCLQSFPASGTFQMSEFFESVGQSIRVSASVLPMNVQDWFPLGWTGLISLQFKGLSRVFNTAV